MKPPSVWSRLVGVLARLRSLGRGLRNRSGIESEMREEFAHHIAMRAEHLEREGIAPDEAIRQAHREFGHVETHRRQARAARGLRFFDQIRFSWIDVRLGIRMLMKYPGLTLVSLFALGVGIPVGMAPMHLADAVDAPLPEDTENRIRALRLWNPVDTNVIEPTMVDFELWREELSSFDRLAAFQRAYLPVISDDGRTSSVIGAFVTASTFEILGVAPHMGRTFSLDDQASEATDVVLIGFELWSTRFGSDPGILGREIRIGDRLHTVVGVMPEGFLFPANDQVWLPLRENVAGNSTRAMHVQILGRLAEGVSTTAAQAEIETVQLPVVEEVGEIRSVLRPEVVSFSMLFLALPRGGMDSLPEFPFLQFLAVLLLLIACGNVAMLIFARTATRFRELAVRSALGASRIRIVSQVFVETMVLALVAAAAGVFAVDAIFGNVELERWLGIPYIPYWFTLDVTGRALFRGLLLAILSAAVAGVLPALWITGRDIHKSVRQSDAARSGIRFGGMTGALIVMDIAVAVVVVSFAVSITRQLTDIPSAMEVAGVPAQEYLAVEVGLPTQITSYDDPEGEERLRERAAATQSRLVEQLKAEPGVRAVAVASALPRMDHTSRLVEVEGAEQSDVGGRYVRTARVDVDYFEELNQPILQGRGFDRADLQSDAPGVIVNAIFVERLLGGDDPIGRRIRFVNRREGQEGTWHPIIGTVGHLGVSIVDREGPPAVYSVAAPGEIVPLRLGIHVSGPPENLIPRVRELVAETDPNAILEPPVALSEVYQAEWYLAMAVIVGLVVLVGVLVALAASGIYAIVSFSVAERTREIGVRAALGAPRRSLIGTILRRSLLQIAIGAILGMVLSARIVFELSRGTETGTPIIAFLTALGLAVGIVSAVGLFSCVVPARRILRIEANEALRTEG